MHILFKKKKTYKRVVERPKAAIEFELDFVRNEEVIETTSVGRRNHQNTSGNRNQLMIINQLY